VGAVRLVVAQRHRGAASGKAHHRIGSAAAAIPLDLRLRPCVLRLRVHGSGWGLREFCVFLVPGSAGWVGGFVLARLGEFVSRGKF
jgi:hypothetical protein